MPWEQECDACGWKNDGRETHCRICGKKLVTWSEDVCPASAEPEGPSDAELEACRNPLMRVLDACDGMCDTLYRWQDHVQVYRGRSRGWTYTVPCYFGDAAYRLVREPRKGD